MSKKKIAAAFVTVLVCVILNVLIMRRHEAREAATVNFSFFIKAIAKASFLKKTKARMNCKQERSI